MCGDAASNTGAAQYKATDSTGKVNPFTFHAGSYRQKSSTYRLGNTNRVSHSGQPYGGYYNRGFTNYKTFSSAEQKKYTYPYGASVKVDYQNSNRYYYFFCAAADRYGVDYFKYDWQESTAHETNRYWMEFQYECLPDCPMGEYRKNKNEAACTKCSACSKGEYGKVGTCSTNGGDRVCVSCDASPGANFYEATKCTSVHNNVWMECDSACDSNKQVEIRKCKDGNNVLCADLSDLTSVVTIQGTTNTGKIASLKSDTEEQIENLNTKIDVVVENAITNLKVTLTADIKDVTDEFGVFKAALKDAFAAAAGITSTFAYAGEVVDGSGSDEESAEPAKIKSSAGTIKVTIANNSHMTVNDKVIVNADEIKATMDKIVQDTFGSVSGSIN
jgi:hypothetical protein